MLVEETKTPNLAVSKSHVVPDRNERNDEQLYRDSDRFMFESEVASDVTLVADSQDGPTVSIPAHKYVLVSRNPVFRAMLIGPLASAADTITIPDMSSEALLELLRYMYYQEVNITDDVAFELLYASSKYMMPCLTARCSEFIAENIDAENVCVILEYARLYGNEKLVNKCLKYIQRNTAQTLTSGAFTGASRETLQCILDLRCVSTSEDNLLCGLLSWAETRLNLQTERGENNEIHNGKVFNGLLSRVRANSLSEAKIQELADSGSALSADLSVQLSLMKKADEDFGFSPRLEIPTGKVICDVISTSSSALLHSGRACAPLLVETSEPIKIHKVFILDQNPNTVPRVSVRILQHDELLNFGETFSHANLQSSHHGSVFAVNLPTAVHIKEGKFSVECLHKIHPCSYHKVQLGVPKSDIQTFGGFELRFPSKTTATPIASFEFSVA